MQRIYLPNIKFSEILEISEKDLYHQLTRVLRARIDQEVVFFDGKNLEDHLYSMIHIDKKSVSFKKKETIPKSSECHRELTLYQACPNKLSKFEVIVQKCSEIGYRKIVFFESERSQKLIISDSKKERLGKIAIEAIEQCGGNIIPEIQFISSLSSQERDWGWGLVWESIICHTTKEDSQSLSELSLWKEVNIIVGPEGWFSVVELQVVDGKKAYFWSRILRCETVGEVVWFYLTQKK